MRVRNILATAAILAGSLGAVIAGTSHQSSDAATTRLQTVTQTETIVNSKCYDVHKVTTTYYHHSSTLGWIKYPSPKVTTTNSETCDK
jgi:hypothetical protein